MIEFILKAGGMMPARGSLGAAGLDIRANEAGIIGPHERVLIGTGVFLNRLPPNTYLRIAPRSKLAHKHGIDVLAGVVDADYRGEIMVILFNTSIYNFTFLNGDAIAQLILETITPTEVRDVTDELAYNASARGDEGINSQDERR